MDSMASIPDWLDTSILGAGSASSELQEYCVYSSDITIPAPLIKVLLAASAILSPLVYSNLYFQHSSYILT